MSAANLDDREKCFRDLRLAYAALEAGIDPPRLNALRTAATQVIDAIREAKPAVAYAIVRAPDYVKLHADARDRMLPYLEKCVIESLPRLGIRLEALGLEQADGAFAELLAIHGILSRLVYQAPPNFMPRLDEPPPRVHPLARRLEIETDQRVRRYVEALRVDMEGPDPPDMRLLAANQFRIELLAWICESAGLPGNQTLETQARITARLVLRRVTTLIESFLASGDMAARVDLAMTFAAIDDLLLFMVRVIEGNAEEHRGMAFTFNDTQGIGVLEEFGLALDRLVQRYLGEAVDGRQTVAAGALAEVALQILLKAAILGAGVRRSEPIHPETGSEVEMRAALAASQAVAADRLLATVRIGVERLQRVFGDPAALSLTAEQKNTSLALIADLGRLLHG